MKQIRVRTTFGRRTANAAVICRAHFDKVYRTKLAIFMLFYFANDIINARWNGACSIKIYSSATLIPIQPNISIMIAFGAFVGVMSAMGVPLPVGRYCVLPPLYSLCPQIITTIELHVFQLCPLYRASLPLFCTFSIGLFKVTLY